MASTSNQGPNPNRGRKRRRPSTAAVVAGTVGKVLGTFLLICVITGAILLCFAAVYIKTSDRLSVKVESRMPLSFRFLSAPDQ